MRILIAGVHPLYGQGLAVNMQDQGIGRKEDIHIMSSGDDFLSKLHQYQADWFLLDIGNSYDIIQLEEVCKPLIDAGKKVTLFTDSISPARIRDIITRIGVNGVIPKQSSSNLVASALHLIQAGGRYLPELVLESKVEGFAEAQSSYRHDDLEERLTHRQMEVLEEVGKASSNRHIADALKISIATVKLHVNAILRALNVSNRTEAALLLYKSKENKKRRMAGNNNDIMADMSCRSVPLPAPHTTMSTPVFDMSDVEIKA